MIHRLLLALLGCLLALAAPASAHTTASRLPVVPTPVAVFAVEFSDAQDCGPLTLHLDGLHDRAGPCGGVLVRQNPWSAFDPIGLSERETRELVNRMFDNWGFVGTVGRWLGLDDALTSSLNTADERMTANAAAGRGRTLSTREYVGAIAEGSAPAAKIAVVATGAAAGPTVTSFIITRPIPATAIGGATVETIAGVDNGYVSPTSVVPHAPNSGTTVEVVEESARRIAITTQAAKRAGTLTRIGEDAWQSSGGLKYVGLDKNGLNRIEHVLAHVVPAAPGKSVFNVPRNQILGLLDEAYASVARVPVPGDPSAFIIPMGRTVGTAGENAVRLILRPGTSEVISAYPVKFP